MKKGDISRARFIVTTMPICLIERAGLISLSKNTSFFF